MRAGQAEQFQYPHRMFELNDILAYIDLSSGAAAVLQQSVRLASLHRAKLHLVHVIDSAHVLALAGMHQISYRSQAERCEIDAHTDLQLLMERAEVPENVNLVITIDSPVHGLLKMADDINPDMLVAGIDGLGRVGAGRCTCATGCCTSLSKLARKSKMTVLLLRERHLGVFKRVVACVDFSETAGHVVEQAGILARRDGAKLDLLHVWSEPWVVEPAGDVSIYPSVIFTEGERNDHMENLKTLLHAFVDPLVHDLLSREVILESISYSSSILRYSKLIDADLVAIGNAGHLNLRYLLIGSTADMLLRLSTSSLMIIKSERVTEDVIGFF